MKTVKTISSVMIILIIIIGSCSKGTDEKLTGKGFNIYLSEDTIINGSIDISTMEIEKEPFIAYDDIEWYDSSEYIFKMSISVDSIFNYGKSMDYRGFVACLDTIKLFYGIFYSPIHSNPNPNIVISLPCDNLSECNRLKFYEGYPNSDYYKSYLSVNDKRFIDLLKKDNKLK
jgi:hypothetical protein